MKPLDEIQVAIDFRSGDRGTFEKVFDLFYPRIYGFAQSLLGKDNAVAEDITMESFAKLFRKYADFDTLINMRAFLYIATRNGCFDYLRYAIRQDALNKEWMNTAEQHSFIELREIEGEILHTVKEAIAQLPRKCRQIIQMIYFEGLSTAEIASRLSISIPTVRSQKRHGINLLRAAFVGKESNLSSFILFLSFFGIILFLFLHVFNGSSF